MYRASGARFNAAHLETGSVATRKLLSMPDGHAGVTSRCTTATSRPNRHLEGAVTLDEVTFATRVFAPSWWR